MSATRDTEQQHTKFIFSNFYHLYLQRKAAKAAEPASTPLSGMVLRSGRVTEAPVPAEVHVASSHGNASLKKWVNTEAEAGRASIAEQIKTLRDARKRLNFLMQEIDELLKQD